MRKINPVGEGEKKSLKPSCEYPEDEEKEEKGMSGRDYTARGDNVGVCYGDKCPLSCSLSLGQTWPVLRRLKSPLTNPRERWTLSLADN